MHRILATSNRLPPRILKTIEEGRVSRRLSLNRIQERLTGHDVRLQTTSERLQTARCIGGVADHCKRRAALAPDIPHLTLRTRIKRLTRKTICFSKSTRIHDLVIDLFVNRDAFERPMSMGISTFRTRSI